MKENKVYRKIDGEYVEIGQEWSGFPSNGIWYVADGRQNLVTKLDLPEVPPYLPALDTKVDECANYVYDKIQEKQSYSYADVARWAAEYYAALITQEDFPEAFL